MDNDRDRESVRDRDIDIDIDIDIDRDIEIDIQVVDMPALVQPSPGTAHRYFLRVPMDKEHWHLLKLCLQP